MLVSVQLIAPSPELIPLQASGIPGTRPGGKLQYRRDRVMVLWLWGNYRCDGYLVLSLPATGLEMHVLAAYSWNGGGLFLALLLPFLLPSASLLFFLCLLFPLSFFPVLSAIILSV